ncbi:MAG: hypothetical protein ABIH72_05830 [archaeon]
MPNANVDYVKSHIEDDIKRNISISGVDYSPLLGTILQTYLSVAPVFKGQGEFALFDSTNGTIFKLEEHLLNETGKLAMFHDTKKCAMTVMDMVNEGDEAGIEEVRKYAEELVDRGSLVELFIAKTG